MHYEDYPYPPRKATSFCYDPYDTIETLCHHFRWQPNRFTKVKILVAGCGTGDAVLWLAAQFKYYGFPDAKIFALDLSAASLAIAAARCKYFEVSNYVEFIQGDLLNINLAEPFDYINCGGVLHHLSNPIEGLKELNNMLKPDGFMRFMLYGKHGRTGIYQIQEIMRRVCTPSDSRPVKLQKLKTILRKLPKSNWLHHQKDWFLELISGEDAGLYDMFLHSSDRAYTVDEIYELLAEAELHLVRFNHAYIYDPDEMLGMKITGLTRRQREALAELALGKIVKHDFYCSRQPHIQRAISPDSIISTLQTPMVKPDKLVITTEYVLINLSYGVIDMKKLISLINAQLTLGEIQAQSSDINKLLIPLEKADVIVSYANDKQFKLNWRAVVSMYVPNFSVQ